VLPPHVTPSRTPDDATPTTGAVTSFIAASVASLAGAPSSMWRSTADHHDRIVDHEPMAQAPGRTATAFDGEAEQREHSNVPINETGTASADQVARQLCRNRNTTSATSSVVSRRGDQDSPDPSVTGAVVPGRCRSRGRSKPSFFSSAISP